MFFYSSAGTDCKATIKIERPLQTIRHLSETNLTIREQRSYLQNMFFVCIRSGYRKERRKGRIWHSRHDLLHAPMAEDCILVQTMIK